MGKSEKLPEDILHSWIIAFNYNRPSIREILLLEELHNLQ